MKTLFAFLCSLLAVSGATTNYLGDAPRTNSAVFVDTNRILMGSGTWTWGLPWSHFGKIAKPLAVQSGTALDWSGTFDVKTLVREVTGDTAFTFSNLPTSPSNSISLVLILTNNGPAGVASVTFPSDVQWIRSVGAPNVTQVSNTVTVFEFIQTAGGRVFGLDIGRDTSLLAGSAVTMTSSGPTTTVAVATGSFLSATNPSVTGNFTLGSNILLSNSPTGLNIKGVALAGPALFVATNGNVGVGTATPAAPLHVIGNIWSSTSMFADRFATFSGGVTDFVLEGGSSGDIVFKAGGGGEDMRLKSSGNFGIGTTTPTERLSVQGNATISTNLWATGTITAVTGDIVAPSTRYFVLGSRSLISAPSIGAVRLSDNTDTTFNRLILGSATAAYPSLGRTNGDIILFGGDGLFGGVSTNRLFISPDTAIGPFGINTNSFGTTAGNGALVLSNASVRGFTYYRTNGVTAAQVEAGLNNGDFTQGVISNAMQMAWKSNDVVLWKIIAP